MTAAAPSPPAPPAIPAAPRLLAEGLGVDLGGVRALDRVDLAVGQGEFVAVMGPSGSGKSTLLYALAGLERPTRGRTLLDGVDLAGLRRTALARMRRDRIAFVFQHYNLVPFLSVADNVALPARVAGRRVDGAALATVLDSVGIGQLADAFPHRLSGGEQQRVAIARALYGGYDIVLADEPTGALDTTSAAAVLNLLAGLARGGRAVLMVTHDPVAAARAGRVVYLRDGAVVGQASGETAEAIAARVVALTGGAAA